jgi:hypothetical protein
MVKMRGVQLSSREKTLVLVGIIIASIGFGLHFIVPGNGRSGIVITVEPMDVSTKSISLSSGPVEQHFLLDFFGPNQTDFSVYLLSESQFQSYTSGTPLSNFSEQIFLDEDGRATYRAVMNGNLNLFLVMNNNGTESTTVSYYYSLLPSSFFSTMTIGFVGVFLILFGFGLHYSGWKRYFLIGLSTNLIFFLVRIFTLANYSLGLPDIFLDLIHVELYNDYQFFYLSWIPNLWEYGWPYSANLPVYLYPPLWIYTVSIFGSTPPWLPGTVLFSFNVATGILVYKIAEAVTSNEKRASLVMMIYLLNPITVGYGSFMWLNPTIFVFFSVLSFYFALNNRTEFSIIALGVATLYKQFAVIFFPILAMLLIKQVANRTRRSSIIQFLKHTVLYTLIVGLVSLPFLIVSPDRFFTQVLRSTSLSYEQLTTFTSSLGFPVHFNAFFLWLFGSSIVTDIIAWLIYNFVLLVVCGLVVYGAYATYNSDNQEESSVDTKNIFMKAILWSFIAVLCLHTFFPRGVYKFYLLALMPFAALLYDYRDLKLEEKEPFTFKKHQLFVPLITTAIFLCFRFVYLWIIVVWAWFYLYKSGELSRIRSGIITFFSKFKPRSHLSSERMENLEAIYSE